MGSRCVRINLTLGIALLGKGESFIQVCKVDPITDRISQIEMELSLEDIKKLKYGLDIVFDEDLREGYISPLDPNQQKE